ncbi:class I SAM-dependent methyltransferase [Candidatus Latescibacterota bacterium]
MNPECNNLHKQYTSINLAFDKKRVGRLDFILDMLTYDRAIILDVGCGPGVQFISHTKQHDFTGIDISAVTLKKAQKNGYKTVCYDLSKGLPFEKNSFDIVILSDILEHLMDPLYLMNEAKRVLKENGKLIISVPNHFFLLNRLRILCGYGLILPWENHQLYNDWNYFHIRFFRWRSICSLLEHCNLEIEYDFSDHFEAPLPRLINIPVLRRFLFILFKSLSFIPRDIWTLHFITVCRMKDNILENNSKNDSKNKHD